MQSGRPPSSRRQSGVFCASHRIRKGVRQSAGRTVVRQLVHTVGSPVAGSPLAWLVLAPPIGDGCPLPEATDPDALRGSAYAPAAQGST